VKPAVTSLAGRWSRIACAGILRDVPYDDDVRRLQETSHARDVEGKLLEIVLGGKIGLDEKALGEIRAEIAAQAKDIAAKRAKIERCLQACAEAEKSREG
jgi:hypothetical protein